MRYQVPDFASYILFLSGRFYPRLYFLTSQIQLELLPQMGDMNRSQPVLKKKSESDFDLILEKQSKKQNYNPQSHLITYWAIVIYITDGHFHHGLCDKKPISGSDIEEVNVLFFSIKRSLHIYLPLTLHQAQGKPSSGVSSCNENRASEDRQWSALVYVWPSR